MWQAIDIYCERTDAGLLAEPVNALTNLAFLAAGLWGLSAAKRHGTGAFGRLLCWLVVLIGIGSALFHTFANRLTMLADVIPIGIFTLLYSLYCLRVFLALSWPRTVLWFVAFYGLAIAAQAAIPDSFAAASNGSTGYFVPFAGLFVFGVAMSRAGHPAGRYTLAAAGIFVVSVAFRSLDAALCEAFPLGTHFMWHLLNGLLLGVLLAAVTRHGAGARPAM